MKQKMEDFNVREGRTYLVTFTNGAKRAYVAKESGASIGSRFTKLENNHTVSFAETCYKLPIIEINRTEYPEYYL